MKAIGRQADFVPREVTLEVQTLEERIILRTAMLEAEKRYLASGEPRAAHLFRQILTVL